VYAVAAKHNRVDNVAVVADLAPPIIAVHRTHWSTVVAGRKDALVPYDDGSYCLLDAPAPDFQNLANRDEVLVVIRPKLAEYFLVVFYFSQTLLSMMFL